MSSDSINTATDPRGAEPLFAEVARALRSDLTSGRLRAGQRLAPERELSVRIGVSRNTLRRALLQLEQKGLIAAAGRHGWYVAAAPIVEHDHGPSGLTGWAREAGVSLTSRVLHQRLRRATAEEAESLALAPRSRVFELERVRIVDGDPLSLDRSCLPGRLADALYGVEFESHSLYDVLAERCGLVPGARECTLRAAVADARTAGELGIPAGAPLLVVQEAVLDQHGDPLEFAVLANRGDRWRYRTTQMTREVESR